MNRDDFSPTMLKRVADILAEENLETVNRTFTEIEPNNGIYSRYVKRALDCVIAFLALVVTLPVNVILAVVTLLDVGSPIFFKQMRTGKDGRNFCIIKFRNMNNATDSHGELLPPDQRVTKVGKFVRKTSLDELLNFWSVLKGDMSIIGPRPLLTQYMDRYSNRHRDRLKVRPGLECPPHKDVDGSWTWDEQFENDLWYVENVSFKTDLYMLFRLVKMVFNRKEAGARGGATRKGFMGYSQDGKAIGLESVPQSIIDRVNGEFEAAYKKTEVLRIRDYTNYEKSNVAGRIKISSPHS